MKRKVVVMTGATSGFGVAWLTALTKDLTADFYILARSKTKFDSLAASFPVDTRRNLHFIPCELSSLESVAAAAKLISNEVKAVDILINNAGIFPSEEPSFNQDNIELTLVVNHLAPLLLTLLLKEQLHRSVLTRVIYTASFQHAHARLKPDDLGFRDAKYTPMRVYQNSKLCNVLSTRYLSQHLGGNISVNCFDPGIVDTSMTKSALPKAFGWLHPFVHRFFRSPEKGAETGVYLSVSEEIETHSGGYYRDKKLKRPSAAAQSMELSEQLHQSSMKYIGSWLK